jgi:hypothetical protein
VNAAWRIRPLEPEKVDRVGAVLGLSRLQQGDGFYLVAVGRRCPSLARR